MLIISYPLTAPLEASIEPSVQTVEFGRSAIFNCKYSGNPVKSLYWLKDGKPLGQSSQVVSNL